MPSIYNYKLKEALSGGRFLTNDLR